MTQLDASALGISEAEKGGAQCAAGEPTLDGLLSFADRTLDWERLREIEREAPTKGSEIKYLDANKWLRRKWQAAVLLDLVESTPLQILDLGTGAGHFPFVAEYLGHTVTALDMPGIRLYDVLCDWIGVPKISHKIEPFEKLPLNGQRFDLVTAFMLGFNTLSDGSLYGLEEWEFFLDDVRDNLLVEGGSLCLKMTQQLDRRGPKYGDSDLQALFSKRGARFEPADRYAIFAPLR